MLGMRLIAGALCLVLGSVLARSEAAQQPSPPLVLEATIPLPDTGGRIDHMAVDLRRGRLFVAELGNGTVDAVDLASRRVVHRIAGLREPQGVGYSPSADILAVASAGDGSVRLFGGENLARAGIIQLGSDADNVRVDPSGRFVVGYGEGALAVVNPATRAVVGQARLPAHPEGFQLLQGSRAVVNVPDARQIAVVDLASGQQLASWRVQGFGSNFPIALNSDGRQIAAAFRSPHGSSCLTGRRAPSSRALTLVATRTMSSSTSAGGEFTSAAARAASPCCKTGTEATAILA